MTWLRSGSRHAVRMMEVWNGNDEVVLVCPL